MEAFSKGSYACRSYLQKLQINPVAVYELLKNDNICIKTAIFNEDYAAE